MFYGDLWAATVLYYLVVIFRYHIYEYNKILNIRFEAVFSLWNPLLRAAGKNNSCFQYRQSESPETHYMPLKDCERFYDYLNLQKDINP